MDHLNVYATKDMSLFMILKAIFNDVKVILKFQFENRLTDGGLENLILFLLTLPLTTFSHTRGPLLPGNKNTQRNRFRSRDDGNSENFPGLKHIFRAFFRCHSKQFH